MDVNKKQHGGKHYVEMGVQPWDVIATWPIEQQIGFYRGNVLKYVMRAGSKDEPLQEYRKASHYLEKLIDAMDKQYLQRQVVDSLRRNEIAGFWVEGKE